MMYGIAEELNDRNFHVWKSRGQVTMLPMAIPHVEILAVQFFTVCVVAE